ncbi:MAG: disulfide bond formation protein B, partial [Gammaproteobacteria bacterium]
LSRRAPFAFIALACIGLLSFAYLLQVYADQAPCPLCIFQRLAYFAIAIVALLAAAHGARLSGAAAYYSLITIVALIGASIAGRQSWLQHLPEDLVPECGPGLDFMLDTYPLGDTIRKVFEGSGECAKVDWTFLSFSIAEWSLLSFLLLAICSTGLLIVRARHRPLRRRYHVKSRLAE